MEGGIITPEDSARMWGERFRSSKKENVLPPTTNEDKSNEKNVRKPGRVRGIGASVRRKKEQEEQPPARGRGRNGAKKKSSGDEEEKPPQISPDQDDFEEERQIFASTPQQAAKTKKPIFGSSSSLASGGSESIYDSDDERFEFSPSGRRFNFEERSNLLTKKTDWVERMDQDEMFDEVLERSLSKKREELMNTSSASGVSMDELENETELDYKIVQRRHKQLLQGKNTPEYEFYRRSIDKPNRNRRAKANTNDYHPQTPDKFGKLSRRAFDGAVRDWKRSVADFYRRHGNESASSIGSPPRREQLVVADLSPRKRAYRDCGDESTLTGTNQRTPQKRASSTTVSALMVDDDAASDGFGFSPKKSMRFNAAPPMSSGLTNQFNLNLEQKTCYGLRSKITK